MSTRPMEAARTEEVQGYFDSYSDAVFRLGRRIAGNEADAEEVRQETFVRLQEQLPRLDLSGNMAGWIFRTATNIALKIRERRFARLHKNGEALVGPAQTPALDDLALDLSRVLRAVEQLPDPERRLIWDRFREGRTPSEIARRAGIDSGTVRMRLFRAMDLLRETLRAQP